MEPFKKVSVLRGSSSPRGKEGESKNGRDFPLKGLYILINIRVLIVTGRFNTYHIWLNGKQYVLPNYPRVAPWSRAARYSAESCHRARVQGWASSCDNWKTLSVNPAVNGHLS